MAEIKSFPNNRDEYIGAEPAMKWLHGRTSGVFAAQGCCTVAPALDTMSVTVSDGTGWLSNAEGDGIAWWISSEKDTGAKLKLRLDMADSIFPRIDRVIVSWPTTNYVALPEVKILKGAPGSNPAAPALTNSNIVRQISLASIRIPAGATRITGDMITDERLDKDVCGLVTEGAEIDTAQMQGKFDTWFAGVKNQLDGDVAGNLLNQINALRDSSATKTYADLAGIVQASYYKSGTVHVLTAQTGAKNLKFKASAAFSDGDTIRLNGVTMVARTQDGESLSGGAWAAGAVVMCFVEGSTLFFKGGGGRLKPSLPFLYKPGDECWVTTGGYDRWSGMSDKSTVTITRKPDRLSVLIAKKTQNPLYTNRYIEFQNLGYKTLKIQIANLTGILRVGVTGGRNQTPDFKAAVALYKEDENYSDTLSIDISALTTSYSSYYVCFSSQYTDYGASFDVLKIWLE